MVDTKRKVSTKVLMGVLLLLLVVVVVLIVAIVMLSVSKNNVIEGLSDDNLAKECLLMDDESVWDCLEDKAFSYYEEGDCAKALKVYDDVPENVFDKYLFSDLYDDAYSMSLDCEDETLQDYWKNKFEELSNQMETMN